MTLKSLSLIGTTNASGDVTIDANIAILGRLEAVQWVDGDLADGVDGTLTVQNGGGQGVAHTLLTLVDANADAMYYPRAIVHSEAGVALTGTSGGDRTLFVIAGKLRLVIAAGGDTHTGGCVVYYHDGS